MGSRGRFWKVFMGSRDGFWKFLEGYGGGFSMFSGIDFVVILHRFEDIFESFSGFFVSYKAPKLSYT